MYYTIALTNELHSIFNKIKSIEQYKETMVDEIIIRDIYKNHDYVFFTFC